MGTGAVQVALKEGWIQPQRLFAEVDAGLAAPGEQHLHCAVVHKLLDRSTWGGETGSLSERESGAGQMGGFGVYPFA